MKAGPEGLWQGGGFKSSHAVQDDFQSLRRNCPCFIQWLSVAIILGPKAIQRIVILQAVFTPSFQTHSNTKQVFSSRECRHFCDMQAPWTQDEMAMAIRFVSRQVTDGFSVPSVPSNPSEAAGDPTLRGRCPDRRPNPSSSSTTDESTTDGRRPKESLKTNSVASAWNERQRELGLKSLELRSTLLEANGSDQTPGAAFGGRFFPQAVWTHDTRGSYGKC